MHLDEVEPPVPGKGRVLVRVLAAAANPMDWKFRNGDSRLMPVNIAGITGPVRDPRDYTVDDMTQVLMTIVVGYLRVIPVSVSTPATPA